MSISETLEELLEQHGQPLLNDARRLEGFLKDLHPEEEREVFLLIEAHDAGFVSHLRAHKNIKEAQRQQLALQLVFTSGIAITHACWAIDTWSACIPRWGYFSQRETHFQGTLDEVFRKH